MIGMAAFDAAAHASEASEFPDLLAFDFNGLGQISYPNLVVLGSFGHVCRACSFGRRNPTKHHKEVYRVSDTTNIFEQMPDEDTFGGRFSRARDAIGLTATELAWRLGVKTSTINAWETDRSQPGSRRLALLSGLLGVSLSWLLHGVGIGPSEVEATESDEAFGNRLARLKALHLETGNLIVQIQGDLDRIAGQSGHRQSLIATPV